MNKEVPILENVEDNDGWKVDLYNILRYLIKELIVVAIISVVLFTIKHLDQIFSFSLDELRFIEFMEYLASVSALIAIGLILFIGFSYQSRTTVGVQAGRYRSPNQKSAHREFISQQAGDWHKAMASVILFVFAVIFYSLSQL